MRRIIGCLLSAGLLAACGGPDAAPESTPPPDLGVQLAKIELDEGRSVGFYEVPEHGIITVSKGPRGTPLLDGSGLENKSITEVYRALSGQEPPEALVSAAQRLAEPSRARMSLVDRAPEARQETALGPSGGVSQLGAPDTTWFVNNFCTGLNSEYDSVWCPTTGYIGAHSGWGPLQKFYQTCGTTGDAAGTLWFEKWASGAWQRLWTGNLATWQWACVWGWGVAQYRSGIDSTNNVLFSERFRYAIPTITGFLGDNPRDRSYENFSDDIQGITHDANNWYLTRNETNFWKDTATNGIIAKQAMTDINGDPPIRYRMPDPWYAAGFRHYGDLVHVNGLIYVAMDGGNTPIAGVGVWNTNLNYIGFNYLPGLTGVAFLAYNPRDRLFYVATNQFGPTTIKGYEIGVSGNTVTVTERRSFTLMSSVPSGAWIQGGKISARGNLYMTVGGGSGPFGVYMIDIVNGFVQTFYGVDPGTVDEFEGLDLWDLDADQRMGAWGQIHFQKINIDLPGRADDYWLAHYRVDDPSKL